MSQRVHVIGAGMAGLSAAVRLADAGRNVTLYEASPHAGGRCRSYFDKDLEYVLDNGAHLMMSGNKDISAYIDLIGSAHEVFALDRAIFDFIDVEFDKAWTIDLGAGHGRWSLLRWIFDATRRPPEVGALALLKEVLALRRAQGKTVAECLDMRTDQFRSFWEPLCVGVLNTKPENAAAELLWAVFEETVLLGGHAARPLLTRNGLGAALVDPALARLKDLGAEVQFGHRVRDLEFKDGLVSCLDFAHGAEVLGEQDDVILAVPHFVVGDLIEYVSAPQKSNAILNVHYWLNEPVETSLKGVVGSPVQWIFTRDHIASVTMSAADDWTDRDADDIAETLWPDVVRALNLKSHTLPSYRTIKERRATFAQTPKALALRPNTKTKHKNLFLAGDWTNTGLPATIEGAVRSGRMAAEAVLG